ncbi:STAS-like domain-containing protein [Aeromonas caviae]|uniref:STAS-like domain-containing protein n=1 Tax=Aeromonas caviae TaxID=648 RepID=UPI002B467041|nr:DUF4325 domain-containing protein [Aeromonas caviae]
MTSHKDRGDTIRRQILRDVKHHPRDIVKHIANIFSITPQAVSRHINKLEHDGYLVSSGVGKGKNYSLGDIRNNSVIFEITNNLAEDKIWREHFAYIFDGLAENIKDICHYGFTEILNNAIDHSDGNNVFIYVSREADDIKILIADDGEGIFKRIKRLFNLSDERQSLLELSKGKLTTDPDNHSGEGIFFTSRAFDKFTIDSLGVMFSHDGEHPYDFIHEIECSHNDKISTLVVMQISRSSETTIKEIFDRFTDSKDSYRFDKTVIPVRLALYENEKLISRSQAKRLLTRIERFNNVVFDFEGVPSIGQAFADEVFRVYANKNPHITMATCNMTEEVANMVNRAKNNN